MPLGDALTLVFTEPLWTIILSKIVLKINIGNLFDYYLTIKHQLQIPSPKRI